MRQISPRIPNQPRNFEPPTDLPVLPGPGAVLARFEPLDKPPALVEQTALILTDDPLRHRRLRETVLLALKPKNHRSHVKQHVGVLMVGDQRDLANSAPAACMNGSYGGTFQPYQANAALT